MANDEEAVVLACTSLVFCALDLRQSQVSFAKKARWTYPPKSLHFGSAKYPKPFKGFHSNRNVGKHWRVALLQGRKVSSGRK